MFVVKFAKAVRNNPKKSVAAAAFSAWVASYARDKYVASLTLRGECESAVALGRQPLNQFGNATRVTVFLNPAASGGKSTKLYEKYAEPILHLAGFKVHLVNLQYEGEAKKLMSIVEDTDIIVCGGGDGTLSEIVTGLLRRPDIQWKKIPIGILPLGKSNTLCKKLLPNADHEKQPHFISAAASAITKQASTPVDVMQIDGSEGKTVYAVTGIKWGSYCDVAERARKMWYLGFLKNYAAYFLYYVRGKLNSQAFQVAYSNPCEPPRFVECDETQASQRKITGTSVLSNIFKRFWPWESSTTETVSEFTEPSEKESHCVWHEGLEMSSMEFSAEANTHLLSDSRDLASIKVSVSNEEAVLNDFLEKTNKSIDGQSKLQQTFQAGSFKLSAPPMESDKQKQFISIDNDRYEAMDLSVKLLPNTIKMIHMPKS